MHQPSPLLNPVRGDIMVAKQYLNPPSNPVRGDIMVAHMLSVINRKIQKHIVHSGIGFCHAEPQDN